MKPLFNCLCRSTLKPPPGRGGNRRDNKKRIHAEDEELDPMDPSSYSDAPRGGWYAKFLESCMSVMFYALL